MLSGVPTDQLSTGYLDPYIAWFPEPRSIADTGLNQGLIMDLVLKTMYFTSYMSGQEISAMLRLPFYGVIDQVIGLMKKEQLCDVSGTSGLGEAGYQYVLTVKGMERAHQVLARSSYVGAAPVPLAKYIEAIRLETAGKPAITRETVERALRGMILGEELTNQVGAAVNAGKSLFLFGAPGNGKTLLAERIATMLGGHIAIPYALEADGQIIQLFDLNSHRPLVPKGSPEYDSTKAELHDRRWVRIHRPVVNVGGELTMSSLDLIYNESAGFYEAPFQLKANGGLFLIDDFGRQQMSPQALLNRWIVPLEKGIDYLTLKTGKKLQIPFELFLVLSTNLQPEDLVDDAFLRRIQNKLHVPDPTAQHFYEIFLGQCKAMNIPFDQNGFMHLVTKHYRETGRPYRASHPRDLLRQLLGLARYLNVAPELTPQLLDAACATYFVNTKKK
jgi:predicted ATPase with chaperone activity